MSENQKGVFSSSAETHWATEKGWQVLDPLTEQGLLLDMLHSAWDMAAGFETERNRLKAELNRWREIAVAYRIGLSAEGHRMYDELVEEDR